MKQILRYDQLSCRLQVEGLPDVSIGQSAGCVGIITGWTLQWTGRPELEGQRDHLVALMAVLLPYARHLVSGVRRRFSDPSGAVTIEPDPDRNHRLSLRSSQPGHPLLTISLDDAELADLVRVIDALRLDPRLLLALDLPAPQPLRSRELAHRLPLQRRLAAPVGGLAAVSLMAMLSLLLPPPPQPRTPAAPTTTKVAPPRP
jgi:hypothetical protein